MKPATVAGAAVAALAESAVHKKAPLILRHLHVPRGRVVEWQPAYPMKRARKAAGIQGRKAAKAFRRGWRIAHDAASAP